MSDLARRNRTSKGDFGSILNGRRLAVTRTIAAIGFCVAIFLIGWLIYHSNRSIFSIVAALGCIPAGWSAVNMIMLLRARPCSAEAHEQIERVRGGLLVYYDLEMTSYERNYHIASATVLERNVCLFSEDTAIVPTECERHVREQLAQGGYSDVTVKLFTELGRYCDRLSQLEKTRAARGLDPVAEEAAWVPGTRQTCAGILLSISL